MSYMLKILGAAFLLTAVFADDWLVARFVTVAKNRGVLLDQGDLYLASFAVPLMVALVAVCAFLSAKEWER